MKYKLLFSYVYSLRDVGCYCVCFAKGKLHLTCISIVWENFLLSNAAAQLLLINKVRLIHFSFLIFDFMILKGFRQRE